MAALFLCLGRLSAPSGIPPVFANQKNNSGMVSFVYSITFDPRGWHPDKAHVTDEETDTEGL